MSAALPSLFSPLTIGNCTLKNRIVSTGHHTYLADQLPSEELIAYHRARASGGVGLIVSEIVAVHETAGFSKNLLTVTDRSAIAAYRELVATCHEHGCKIFAQLFHPGREVMGNADGMLPIAWAPSAVPNERFHIMPKAMPHALIKDIIRSFGTTASLLAEAGFDGFEIVASHGYLPSQFLNAEVNRREDEYGGSDANRQRFISEVIDAIRAAGDKVVGLRISADEHDDLGLDEDTVRESCIALAPKLDYLNLTAGTSVSLGASVHITPPMGVAHGYVADTAQTFKQQCELPVLVTGRINQPQDAERIIAAGKADLCGMTRALICDPAMPDKAARGEFDTIRACIGCNQACIGRAHKGLGISCIQFPESGRERQFGVVAKAAKAKNVLVAGGGPAGLKTAAVAAARGHKVTLCEMQTQLGGQALLAQRLPGREEFGGIADNLQSEAIKAGVEFVMGQKVDAEFVAQFQPEVLVDATGAVPYVPDFPGADETQVYTAWQLLQGAQITGNRVIIADWRADWIGVGLAEQLALDGYRVTLCTNAALAGEALQLYTRNHYVGRLHAHGVDIRTHARFFGFMEGCTYFQDTLCQQPIEFAAVDALVLSLGHQSADTLASVARATHIEYWSVGDCVTPRTAEEAVYEGLVTGTTI